MLGWAAVDGVDWPSLQHAYGPADDTPGHLRALTGDDAGARSAAIDHLGSAVVHQFSSWTATPPAVRVVGGLLDHPVLRRPTTTGDPALLVEVVDVLIEVAHGAAGATGEAVQDPFVADLLDVLAELVDVVLPLLDDPDELVRLGAVHLLAGLGRTAGAATRAPELAEVLGARLDATASRDERATLVVCLGDLGGDTRPWLADDDEAVRACAALHVPDHPAARDVLLSALSDPTALAQWFTHPPWSYQGAVGTLLPALLAHESRLAAILPAATAVARTAGPYLPDQDWGLLLRFAFPDVVFTPGVQPPPPASIDDAQRALLRALTENPDLWDPKNGSARLARMRVGLPHTRHEVRVLIGDAEPARRAWWRRTPR